MPDSFGIPDDFDAAVLTECLFCDAMIETRTGLEGVREMEAAGVGSGRRWGLDLPPLRRKPRSPAQPRVVMHLRPFFSYYGSKHRIASRYPAPVTGRINDCFAGSGAYPCAYPHLNVTLCEINPKVAGVWDFLIRAPESEVRALPLVAPDTVIAELSIPQEARHLIALWCSRGNCHPPRRPSRWMEQYADRVGQCQFWGEMARHRVARQQRFIRHWRLVCGDYRELPDERADWFR